MKEKRFFEKLYIVIFIGFLASLSLLMPFVKSDMNREKRAASKLPKIVKAHKLNLDYFDELTDYFSDNFAFRQELSTIDAVIKAGVFKTSNHERVVLGKDGWLYFSESMHDYLGFDVMSEREIYNAVRVLELIQENCENRGVKFLFAVAPNKNSLYPENMPDNYIRTKEATNYDMLRDKMEEQGINFVDLHSAFLADERVMYHKWDSHWTNEGAAFAVDIMLDGLGKEHYDYSYEPYTVQAVHRGDLYNILYPSLNSLDDNVIYEREHEYNYVNDVKSTEDAIILTQNPAATGSLVMFRDSYGNASIPYIADEYERGFFSKGQPADLDQIDYQNADTVIYEIVERNIPWLIEYVPYMDAPIRNLEFDAKNVTSAKVLINTEDKGNRILVYGKADKEFTDEDSNIYIVVISDEGKMIFEATPASYDKVESVDEAEYSYGAYINKTDLPDDYELMIMTEKDGRSFCY